MSGFVWTLIGIVSFGGAGLAIALVFLGWPVLIAFAQTKVGKFIVGIATAGVGLVLLYLKGKSAGEAVEREKVDAENQERIKRRAEIERGVADLSDDDLRERMRRE